MAGYVTTRDSETTYFDAAPDVRVREAHYQDIGGAVKVTIDHRYDGIGRVTSDTQLRFVSGAPDAVTSYGYDGSGGLAFVEGPDPRSDAGRVRVAFERDAVGRPVKFIRPDLTEVDVAYSGLDKIVYEMNGAATFSKTTAHYDTMGRLHQVDESDNPTPGVTATTVYEYDPLDRLELITDAEQKPISFDHDWTGNRVTIQRGSRTWTYAYDLDGNVISATAPIPAGASAADYTTQTTYDKVDRVLSRTPAPRELVGNPTRRAALGIGPIVYHYDGGANGLDRLDYVDVPWGKIDYEYFARGLVSKETRTFDLPGHSIGVWNARGVQTISHSYNLANQPTATVFDDGVGWQVKSTTSYDARGLVDSVSYCDPTAGTCQKVAKYTRTVGGLPALRETDFNQRRRWAYDALGRPSRDTVEAGTGATLVTQADKSFKFNSVGDLTQIEGTVAGASASAKYGYDARHRLTAAAVQPVGNGWNYLAAFSYTATGNVNTAQIMQAGSKLSRNVTYSYGVTDSQAVDTLLPIGAPAGAQAWASFKYDLSGNMTQRTAPDATGLSATSTLTWDGENQLRESAGVVTEQYLYDHTGQRAFAMNPVDGVKMWFGEAETHFSKDAAPAGTTPSTPTLRWFHIGDGGALARVQRIGTTQTLELQYGDLVQSLMLALSPTGSATASFVYGAFGEPLGAQGATDHRREFNGKEVDARTGLAYYGARYYDPVTLRWATPDPQLLPIPEAGMNEPARLNVYTFALNQPTRMLDPDGRDPITEAPRGTFLFVTRRYVPFASFAGGFKGNDRDATICPYATYKTGQFTIVDPFHEKVVASLGDGSPSSTTKLGAYLAFGMWFGGEARPDIHVMAGKGPHSGAGMLLLQRSSGHLPLVPGSPDIDTRSELTVTVRDGRLIIEGTVYGDDFPNMEMMVRDSKGTTVTLASFHTTGGNWAPYTHLFGNHDSNVLEFVYASIPLDADGNFASEKQSSDTSSSAKDGKPDENK